MRLAQWLLTASLLLASTGMAHAQLFHKQRDCSCCPCQPAMTPSLAAEPIPPPKGVEPVPPITEPTPFFPQSDIGTDMGGEGLSTFDSAVGYIDNAIPSNLLRLRFDAAWDS